MHSTRSRSPATRRFAWLLWLGLLLPVAQLAAATHALSHARQAASRDEPGSQAPHLAHCDLCLVAAAIGGAVAGGETAMLARPPLGASLPQAVVDDIRPAAPVLAYRSRAPPDAAT